MANRRWRDCVPDMAGPSQPTTTLVTSAAANGRPPAWAAGIYGAELWGLSITVSSTDAWTPLRVDCLSVQLGTQKGITWANAPERCLARVWGPVCAALDDDPQRVVWMPAHCSHEAVGIKRLGNGERLTALDLCGNAHVDKLSKEAARADRLPRECREAVTKLGADLTAIALWIGQATHLANHFPDLRQPSTGKQQRLRDSTGDARKRLGCALQQQIQRGATANGGQIRTKANLVPDSQAGHERLDALRARIQAREQDGRAAPRSSARLVSLITEQRSQHERDTGSELGHGSKRRRCLRYGEEFVRSPPQGAPLQAAISSSVRNVQAELGRPRPVAEAVARPVSPTPVLEELRELHRSGISVRWPLECKKRASAGGWCASAAADAHGIQAGGLVQMALARKPPNWSKCLRNADGSRNRLVPMHLRSLQSWLTWSGLGCAWRGRGEY